MTKDCELLDIATIDVGGPSGASSFVLILIVGVEGFDIPILFSAYIRMSYVENGAKVCISAESSFCSMSDICILLSLFW